MKESEKMNLHALLAALSPHKYLHYWRLTAFNNAHVSFAAFGNTDVHY
jgi:hypothetical protein